MQLASFSKLNSACRSSFRKGFIGRCLSREQNNFCFVGKILNKSCNCNSVRSYCCHRINQYLVKPTSVVVSCRVSRNPMATSGSQTVGGDVYVDNVFMGCGNVVDYAKPASVFFGDISANSCRKASVSLRIRDSTFVRIGAPGIGYRSWDSRVFLGQCLRPYHASSSASYSDGASADVPFDITTRDVQSRENAADTPVCKHEDQLSLKLHSASCYLPHPDKVATGGEDAHFICEEKKVIGVADGVGGWADVGVDAGFYSRLLMSNSVTAILEDSNNGVDPAKILEKAHAETNVIGSSTACIIALTDKGIHAINLGDSGFIVIRDGTTVFRSPAQQYGFNFPYQLASGTGGDLPSSGQVFSFSVAAGDVIVAGTDGLFDNLYDNEISALVVQAKRAGLEPQVMAQNIATLAQQRALDRQRQTPFAAAAHDAGFRYIGGKLDDITVVVSYITAENNDEGYWG
ncbi:probable protein phosphatase 2C 80 isoform X3 [Amaranthus tricolor]|uniref:probable protein phosphatase 2C 80 isoform X3 n=1 Tax=Amaranthus tricolor TaxID=29722 RepID=UPI00258DE5DA|nr:probable protein phosphatase 2C 80 isoform X3 [Amaranthus tricolor]